MSNVSFDASTLGALTVLKGVNRQLDKVSEQVASNYKIRTAADDPTYWSIANTMKGDSKTLATVSDALGLGESKVDTAYTAMDSAIGIVTQIRDKLVSATEDGTDKDQINSDIQTLKESLESIAQSATFSGDNWLFNAGTSANLDKSVVAGFKRSQSGQVYASSITFDTRQSLLIDMKTPEQGLLTKNISTGTGGNAVSFHLLNMAGGVAASGNEIALSSATTSGQVKDMLTVVSSILDSMTTSAGKLGTMSNEITKQASFISNLSDTIDTSVGKLVDTDLESASAQQTALQTAQQIGLQSISIANTMSSKLLILLGGS